MAIPRIIHQIWMQGSGSIPKTLARWSMSWHKRNPTWQYRFWDEVEIVALIQQHYPSLMERYYSYGDVIARADIARYVILSVYGGMYADLDTLCIRPLDNILDLNQYSLFAQVYDIPFVFSSLKEQLKRTSNSIIICEVNHPVIQECLKHIQETDSSSDFWLNITGPPMYSSQVSKYYMQAKESVCLLDHKNIVTSCFLPIIYMKYLGRKSKECFSLDFNWTGRQDIKESSKRWFSKFFPNARK